MIVFCLDFLGVFNDFGLLFLAHLVCKFGVFGVFFCVPLFLMFFYCFNNHFWSFSMLKSKHFVRDVFQISQVVRVTSSFLFVTVLVTVFRAQFGYFLGYVSMRWQCLFFTLLSMRFGTLFGASNEPKTRLPNLRQATIIKYCAPDGCSEGFLGPPGDHFGHFGGAFLIDF